jgi:ribosomal protein L16 Arg81 hydroxylase
MTTLESTHGGTTTPPTTLADLVGDVDSFLADHRGSRPVSFRCPTAPDLLTEAGIWTALDCGLLVDPYFSVVRDGVPVPIADIAVTRNVLNRPMASYASATAIRERFESGDSLRLDAPDHWNAAIKDLVGSLRSELRAEVRSFAVLTPPNAAAVPPPDDAPVFVVQLGGTADWHVDQAGGTALEPGDVLWIPGDHPRSATSGATGSLHLAITVRQPTTRDLAELALAGFLKSERVEEIAGTHHMLTIDEKVAWLRVQLAEHLAGQDLDALVAEAVRLRQRKGQVL